MTAIEKSTYRGFGRIFTVAIVIAVTILVLLALLSPLFGPLLGDGEHDGKTRAARGVIEALDRALAVYQLDYYRPFSWDNSDNDHELAARSVFRMLTLNRQYLDLPSKYVRNDICVDPWGRACHVAIDADNDGEVNIGEATADRAIVIWSEGPNQLNEFGEGDDIRSW